MSGTVATEIDTAEIAVLKRLALESDLDGAYKTSCSILGTALDVSTQTASRRLQSLEEAGLIDRETVTDGQWISVTDAGQEVLYSEYTDYRQLFEGISTIELTGTVESGMGEGRHYVSREQYMEQFIEHLEYEPFPGTLNVGLTETSEQRRGALDRLAAIHIDGFETDARTFGPAVCYPASLVVGDRRYDRAHLIEPERTHHDRTQIELLAPEKLRTALDIDDGDQLTIIISESGT